MSYYVVKRGRIPGIYNDWSDCEKQIKGFSNAKFKKFEDYDLALDYSFAESPLTNVKPTKGIAVDAAYSMKRGEGEYQIFDLELNKMVYNSRIYKDSTVNIMEFLAIIQGLKMFSNRDIYSDSATAITWVNNKKINTNAVCGEETQKEIDEALDYLNSIGEVVIKKWDTSSLGDIPADFNRK